MVFWDKTERLHSSEPIPTVGEAVVTPTGQPVKTPSVNSAVVTSDSASAQTRAVRGTVVTPDGKPVVAGNVFLGLNGNHPGSARVMALDQGKFAFGGVKPGGGYCMKFEVPGHSVKSAWPTVGDYDVSFTSIAHPLQKYRIRVEAPDEPREIWVTAGIEYRDEGVRFGDSTAFWFIQEGNVLALDIPNDGKHQMRLNGKIEGKGSPRFRGALNEGDTLELLDAYGSVLHRVQCLEVAYASAQTRAVRGTVVTPDGKPVVAGNVFLGRNGNHPEEARVMALDQGKFAFGGVKPGGDYRMEFEVPGHSVKRAWPTVGDYDVSFTSIAYPLQKYRIRVEAPDEPRELWVTAGTQDSDSGVHFGDGWFFSFIQEDDVLALSNNGANQMRLNGRIEGKGSPRVKGGLNEGDTLELLDESGRVLHRIRWLEVATASDPT